MADTGFSFGPTVLTTSAATVYTCIGTTRDNITHLHICNETTSAIKVTVSIGTDAAGKRVYKAQAIPGGGILCESGALYSLVTGTVIQAFCDTASAATITGSGVKD